jgi:hypothetical protein
VFPTDAELVAAQVQIDEIDRTPDDGKRYGLLTSDHAPFKVIMNERDVVAIFIAPVGRATPDTFAG